MRAALLSLLADLFSETDGNQSTNMMNRGLDICKQMNIGRMGVVLSGGTETLEMAKMRERAKDEIKLLFELS